MEAMDEAALKLITDEEFDFELVCSPAAKELGSIPGNAVDPERNPEPGQMMKLNAACKEGSHVTCAADSPISESALMQIFSDAQNVASDIESCRMLASCYANRLGCDSRASDGFECSPNVLVSPGNDDSFQLMPGLCGAVIEDSAQGDCVDDGTVSLHISHHSQAHDTAIADLRSRLEHIKSQSAIVNSQNAALMDGSDDCAVDKVDASKVASGDVEDGHLLASADATQPSVASDNCVLDKPEYSPDVLTFQVTSNAADDNSFQLMPDLCAAVTANNEERQKTESVTRGRQSSAINCNRRPPRRSAVGDTKTGELRSSLTTMKSQCRLSMTQKSQDTPVQNRGSASVIRSSSLRLSTSHKSQNAPVQNCGPASVAQPVVRSSSLRFSTSQKSQNASAENRVSGQAVVHTSSLRRIPSFRRSQPIKRCNNADNLDRIDNTMLESRTPSKAVPDIVSSSSNVEKTPPSVTPEQGKPPAVQQGTITKDRTRRLERVAGPDMPSGSAKVQRTNSTRRSLPVHHSTGGIPVSTSADTVQKSGLMKLRTSIGRTAMSARPGWSEAGPVRKCMGTAAPPRCTTAPLKATGLPKTTSAPPKAMGALPKTTSAPPKATAALPKTTSAPPKATAALPKTTSAPPKATAALPKTTSAPPKATAARPDSTVSGLKRGAMVKQRPTGSLQKPVIKKPMTKVDLMKTRGSVAPVGKQAGQGGGPLKATLPLTAAAVQKGEGETRTCPVPVTMATGKPAGHRSGPPTLILTPVNHDRNVRPKRLMHAATPPQANRSSSVSSGTSLRHSASYLPTPTKRRSYCTSSSSTSSSRLTSSSSVDSSVFSGECNDTPVTRVLNDLNGLDSNSSPSGLKLRRPRVQHTPVNKENIAELRVPSVWSPVQRPRALSREEEATQCTKRNVPKC